MTRFPHHLALVAALAPAAPTLAQTPSLASEEGKLVPAEVGFGDRYGDASAVDGDTLVASTRHKSHGGGVNQGAAYVFVRSGTSWTEQAELTPANPADYDFFGQSVAIHGERIVVGSPGADPAGVTNAGAAYVFARSGTVWTQEAVLAAGDPGFSDQLGWSVAIEGDTVLAGAWGDDHSGLTGAGSAYVFSRSGTTWTQQAKLTAGDAEDSDTFGWAVSVSGDTALIGALYDVLAGGVSGGSPFGEGSAYVFLRTATTWSEQAKLFAGDAEPKQRFGYAASASGDTVAIGAYGDANQNGPFAGAAYAFGRVGTSWSQQAKLISSDGGGADAFGWSIALSGEVLLVGATFSAGPLGPNGGAAYVFARAAGEWNEQLKLTASDATKDEWFGYSVGLSGTTAVVGAYQDGSPKGGQTGSAYAYELHAPRSYCTAGSAATGCRATMGARGLPSATRADSFFLESAQVPGLRNGIFFFGANGRQANSWGNGSSYQCVVPPVKRAGLMVGEGTTGLCDSIFVRDLNARWCPTCPKAAHNPGAGATVQAQLWYRDPNNTSNQTTGLSDAVEFIVGP